MTLADIPAGLRLCRASNWNQLAEDWRFFLDHGGAQLADAGDAIAGSVAYLPFGAFSWLSMMLVDPGQRRTGIGSQLMEAALGALGAETCVRLDATPSGEPLYRRFGFTAESVFARTSITAEAGRFRPSSRVLPMQPEDLPAVCSRDREVFGADRSALLADLYRRAPGFAWIAPDAWCFGRPGYRYQQFGPVVAANAAAARELVEHCLASHPGLTVVLDVPQLSDAFGFTVERPFLRMRRGGRADYGAPEHVFAIAGPEFG